MISEKNSDKVSENKIKTPNSIYNEKKINKDKVNIRYTEQELK